MDLTLNAIAFNHIENSAMTDAFTIRKNETLAVDLPEWKPGLLSPEESQAAYARDQTTNQTLTIKAGFTCGDPSVTSIDVQALDGHLVPGQPAPDIVNVLGSVNQTTVPLSGGQSDFVPFTLRDVVIAKVGVSRSDIIWKWQFRLNSSDTWTNLTTTTHRIYTVLALPTDPWKPLSCDKLNSHLPWTDVLDVAFEWAGGAQDIDSTTDSATARITRAVNALGDPNAAGVRKVTYRYNASYVPQGTDNFDCTAFLDRVKGGEGHGKYVNCFDCATAVSSFSNILGANLWQSKMGYNFNLNHVLRIGKRKEDGGDFMRHEVAWTGNATKDDFIFDACLKLDGDSHPGPEQPEHFDPLLPIKIPFGDPADKQYRFRIELNPKSKNPCEAYPATKRRRFIGISPLIKATNSPKELKILSKHYNFPAWKKIRKLEENLLVWKFFLSGNEVPGWRSERLRCFKTIGDMPATSQGFWPKESSREVILRVDTFECSSLPAAHAFLLEVLGESQELNLQRQKLPVAAESYAAGDVAFTDPENLAAFFARGNMVVSVTNAGEDSVLVGEFANRFDRTLKSRPDEGGKVIESMKQFEFPKGKFQVRQQIPIEFLPNGSDQHKVLYRFFTRSGELFFERGQTFYRPTKAGAQEVVVFGVDAEQNAREQRLEIEIEE